MLINNDDVPQNLLADYFEILKQHQIVIAPGKVIEMNKRKITIRIGYAYDNSFAGTNHFE